MSRESALETLGETMRHLRTANGASLTAAALAAGVSKGHLSNVERGRDSPSWDLIDFYEEAYGGDGQLWSAYVETVAGPRQRRPQVTHPAYPIAGDESAFVADVTVPDGTVMPPGFRFEKVWRLRNAGTVPWIGRYLRRLGAPGGLGIPSSPVRVRITDTMPGETVDIRVPLKSHILPGTAEIHWKMVDEDGFEFFPDRYYQGIFMIIVVDDRAPPPNLRRLVPD
ncbi:transcriptional regulator with XRE-family HTH domain [Amycolatopsis lexingtonensis]|uniref:Transcriptional regulator with XRE-family HTH domain n=1 Tax=Amycolatopsis lexingtonensis TaxID=218822 RepID=A0ABR9IAA5_9PSEU|nr:NBR1-Ig-like domain-containing protein [Amycolatopsis lexingtonensis]MBE1500109.1 transcriptional regulator with XRE-family HTH domain [Amycolatopsis lexingtonensis]